jgi:RNA polymerase sigma-70 factor (sigma-E family)
VVGGPFCCIGAEAFWGIAMTDGTRGDDGFSDFVRSCRPALRRYGYLLSGDWHEAEDLVQAALVITLRNWDRLAGPDRAEPYARRVLAREFLAQRRHVRWAREVLVGDPPQHAARADGPVGERLALVSALLSLAPRQRAVIVLRIWEDLSVVETARRMGSSPATVTSQTTRALATLRRILKDPG